MSFLATATRFIFNHRSAIFLGAGLCFGAACVGTTVVQTIKACDIIDDANVRMDVVENDSAINEEETNKELSVIRKKTNLELAKNYIVPAAFGVAAILCLLASYKILSSQRAAALSALASVTAAFDEYRSRVIDKYGVEEDYNIYMGKTTSEVTKEIIDPKTGKVKKVKETVTSINPIDSSCYSRVFSQDTSKEWCFNQKLCVERLRYAEDYLNTRLLNKGYITYNEVIEQLGLSCKLGYYESDKVLPNRIGWCTQEILNAVADKYPGPYDCRVNFVPKIDDDYFSDNKVYFDGAYRLDFNCYPIDDIMEYYQHKLEKGLIQRPA